jgi:hypothetical protein
MVGVIILALGMAPVVAAGVPPTNALITLDILVLVSSAFLVLALWFPVLAVIFERMCRKAREPKEDQCSDEVVYWQREGNGSR